jgi:hypothetical protein
VTCGSAALVAIGVAAVLALVAWVASRDNPTW